MESLLRLVCFKILFSKSLLYLKKKKTVKNLLLLGVSKLTVIGERKIEIEDLLSNPFILDHEVGMNYFQQAVPRLQQLNISCKISCIAEFSMESFTETISQYSVSIFKILKVKKNLLKCT